MDNFICKHCNYYLNIKKVENIKIINNPSEFLQIYKNQDVVFQIKFKKNLLEEYLSKKQYKDNDIKKILSSYDVLVEKNNENTYILKCSCCGSEYELKPDTIIYTINFKNKNIQFNDEDIDLKLYDNTLPRTKDYICQNDKCETHKSNYDLKNKEAVFYRANKLYNIKYACLICKTSWLV